MVLEGIHTANNKYKEKFEDNKRGNQRHKLKYNRHWPISKGQTMIHTQKKLNFEQQNSGRVSSSCSISDTRGINVKRHEHHTLEIVLDSCIRK